ncbi:MarR family winged helix-turn-helix transcriptional regulator [Paenibacillus tarimensis]
MDHKQPELHQSLIETSKRQSTLTVMFHQSVAAFLGLNITDHKCLDFLLAMGKATAGQLSEITGLTTGAITHVLNRLEKAGYVKRTKDPDDRRIVYAEPVYENLQSIWEVFGPLQTAMSDLYTRYSPSEIRTILDYIERSNQILAHQAELLRMKSSSKKGNLS